MHENQASHPGRTHHQQAAALHAACNCKVLVTQVPRAKQRGLLARRVGVVDLRHTGCRSRERRAEAGYTVPMSPPLGVELPNEDAGEAAATARRTGSHAVLATSSCSQALHAEPPLCRRRWLQGFKAASTAACSNCCRTDIRKDLEIELRLAGCRAEGAARGGGGRGGV
jgi:hypothetical protein